MVSISGCCPDLHIYITLALTDTVDGGVTMLSEMLLRWCHEIVECRGRDFPPISLSCSSPHSLLGGVRRDRWRRLSVNVYRPHDFRVLGKNVLAGPRPYQLRPSLGWTTHAFIQLRFDNKKLKATTVGWLTWLQIHVYHCKKPCFVQVFRKRWSWYLYKISSKGPL